MNSFTRITIPKPLEDTDTGELLRQLEFMAGDVQVNIRYAERYPDAIEAKKALAEARETARNMEAITAAIRASQDTVRYRKSAIPGHPKVVS